MAVAILSGCGGPPDRRQQGEAILHVQLEGEPSNIDPAQANDEYGAAIVRSVFQRLYRYQYLSDTYQLRPELATGPPVVSGDSTHYRISIRPGQRFSDSPVFAHGKGRELVAADFVYSIKRHFDPNTGSRWQWLFRDRIVGLDEWGENGADYKQTVAGLVAIDDYTIDLQLTAPFAPLMDILATTAAAIVPYEAVESLTTNFAREPVGSGAYVLTELNSSGAWLSVNPNYHALVDLAAEGFVPGKHDRYVTENLDGSPLPIIKHVQLSFVVDALPSWLLLTDNDNPSHYAKIGASSVAMVFEDYNSLTLKPGLTKRFRIETSEALEVVRFDFNLDGVLGTPDAQHDAADLHALRCALIKAMDWDSRNQSFYNGTAQVFPGVIPPRLKAFSTEQELGSVTLDRRGARKLLLEHHWTASNLPELHYGFQSSVLDRQGFEHFRAMLMQIGYPSEKVKAVSYASFGDLIKGARTNDLDVLLHTWIMDYPDAENILGLYYGPSAGGINFNRYRDQKFDARYLAISTMQPGKERTALIRKMNQSLIDACLFIGSASRQNIMAWHLGLRARPDEGMRAGTWWRFAAFEATN